MPGSAPVVVRPSSPRRRTLSDKLLDIGARSPRDLAAFDVLADEVLRRLDAADHKKTARPCVRP